jgi:site-specific recombinase XerD
MFLRFLISQGRCPDYLYASIPTFVHWRLSALPRYLQADQVEQLIASPDLATSIGRRNRAILLLLARLGLRASDVVQLRLDDLNWREGMIRVSGKGRRQTVLPLTQEVGDALAAYIKDHRPQADTDAVFVRSSAPYRASLTPMRFRYSLLVRCAALASTARSEGKPTFSAIRLPARCYAEECPCRRSLVCSATVPSRPRRFTTKWMSSRWGR